MKKQEIKIVISFFLFIVSILFKFNYEIINNILYFLSYLLVGLEILKKAFRNILKRKVFDENFLMAIATIAAFCIGKLSEAVAVMLFYQVGELFQDFAVEKSKKSISDLMNIRPDYANVYIDGNIKKLNPDVVKVNDIIIVKPGEKIPLDGCLIEGNCNIDTKALTGETTPISVKVGDNVLSGCINLNGVIKIKVTKKFEESTVSKILDLVEN